jgi:CheY-like chemotaxis protein
MHISIDPAQTAPHPPCLLRGVPCREPLVRDILMSTASRKLRVLLVESSPRDADRVLQELAGDGYHVSAERVQTADELAGALRKADWDVVLAREGLPNLSALEALGGVQLSRADLPLIVLCNASNEEGARALMQAGARDYVLEQGLRRLGPAIERELRDAERRRSERDLGGSPPNRDWTTSDADLAARVAHEINNPLAAVIGNLELLAIELTDVAERLNLWEGLRDVFAELGDAREGANRVRRIVLGLRQAGPSASDPSAERAAPRASNPDLPPVRRGRVLIVDDDPMLATVISRTLEEAHDVVVSIEAEAALRRITAGERFDVLLCDLMMPHMTGMDLLAAVLEGAPDQAERMIFLSGGAYTPAAQSFLQAIRNQHLAKPFETRLLLEIVNERLR